MQNAKVQRKTWNSNKNKYLNDIAAERGKQTNQQSAKQPTNNQRLEMPDDNERPSTIIISDVFWVCIRVEYIKYIRGPILKVSKEILN